MRYLLTTTRRNYFLLNESGDVIDRSNGPGGWDYSGQWTILGFGTRFNARHTVPLSAVAQGADAGQGWVHDLDHGTHRVWGNERLSSLRAVGDDYTLGGRR